MAEWSAFYGVTAAASATLLGLLFVAVSVAAPTALNDRQSPIRSLAEQSFQNYLLVLILSCFALFPRMERETTGSVILFVSGSRAFWALVRLSAIVLHSPDWRSLLKALRRQIASLCGLACLLVASTRIASASAEDLHLLAGGTLVLLASSAVASWELLLELVRGRSGKAEVSGDQLD